MICRCFKWSPSLDSLDCSRTAVLTDTCLQQQALACAAHLVQRSAPQTPVESRAVRIRAMRLGSAAAHAYSLAEALPAQRLWAQRAARAYEYVLCGGFERAAPAYLDVASQRFFSEVFGVAPRQYQGTDRVAASARTHLLFALPLLRFAQACRFMSRRALEALLPLCRAYRCSPVLQGPAEDDIQGLFLPLQQLMAPSHNPCVLNAVQACAAQLCEKSGGPSAMFDVLRADGAPLDAASHVLGAGCMRTRGPSGADSARNFAAACSGPAQAAQACALCDAARLPPGGRCPRRARACQLAARPERLLAVMAAASATKVGAAAHAAEVPA